MRPLTRIIIVVWFVGLLAAPVAAYVFGARGRPIENRPLAQAPEVSPGGLLDDDTYRQITAYFTDRLPWRDRAVKSDAWIDLKVFEDSPVPEEVGLGADGWLFLMSTFRRPCATPQPPDQIVARLGRIGSIVEASGRQFVVTIAPNKEALYPEFLGDLESLAECVREVRADLRTALAADPPTGFIDMFTALEEAKPGAAEPLYYSIDSHWTSVAGVSLAERFVEAIQPGAWDPVAVVLEPGSDVGDLTVQIGLPSSIETVYTKVRRTDVRTRRTDSGPPVGPNDYEVSGPGTIIDQRVVVWHDSFVNVVEPMINQYFADSTFTHWRTLPEGKNANRRVANTLRSADAVIFESTERALYSRFGLNYVDMPAALVAALVDDLPAMDLDTSDAGGRQWERTADGDFVTNGDNPAIRMPLPPGTGADRYLVVRLIPSEDGRAGANVVDAAGELRGLPNSVANVAGGDEVTIGYDLTGYPGASEIVLKPGQATVLSIQLVEVPSL